MQDEDDMTLDQWLAFEKERLDRFAADYRASAAAAPKDQHWPLSRGPGEWDEDYATFDDPGPQAPAPSP